MKKIVMIFAAMAAVLSSCQKNELESVSVNEGKDIVLNISVSNPGADDTKALIKTDWAKDDEISIWFNDRTGVKPDLVIKYDGSKWTQKETPSYVPTSGDGYVKAVYSGNVIVASKDNYTIVDETLTFSIENWTFLTEIQVVVTGLTFDHDKVYTLSCDKFTPIGGTGYTVGGEVITAKLGTKGKVAKGISNTDGVAFAFATADYSSTEADYKFTLKDLLSDDDAVEYTAKTDKISDASGHSNIMALTIASSKFAVPAATTGSAKRTGDIDVNWVQLWENGPKFAEYNVGVKDGKAESYGEYYTWGGNQNVEDVVSPTYKGGTDPLTGTDDTATNLWGSGWRMPTQTELAALLSSCDVVWTTVGGVNGCKFTGKGAYASNSVFLPAAGDCSYGDVDDQGYNGYYWSSTPEGSNFAYYLDFLSGYQNVDDRSRYNGCSVRAVLAE